MTRTTEPGGPRRLRCEGHVDPLGIDSLQPRLSWELADDRRGAVQRAYDIVAASSAEAAERGVGDLWKTGRVNGGAGEVVYEGTPLASRDRCWWRVRTWDADDVVSPWSAVASFEMGLLVPHGLPPAPDWRAATIRSHVRGDRLEGAPAPFFRRAFELTGEVVRARLYVTALGLHETWINGRRVSDERMRPGWTDYRIRVPYQTYDVTEFVQPGRNVLGAIVGDGWYCGHNAVGGGRQVYGERPSLYAQLEIELAGQDERVTVPTGPEWRTTTGPIVRSDNYQGEHHDARLELDGWSTPEYDDDDQWDPVDWGPPPMAGLVATVAPPVRVTEELRPIATWESAPGVHVFDLGQNMVGHVRLRVRDGAAGTSIRLRHAEALDADGRSIWTANLGKAAATDTYVCRGAGEEVFEPRFTFHGFRYVELDGYPGVPGPDDVTGVVVHSDLHRTGTFACSDPLVSRLYENIVWSQRGNAVDIPTDCPQRAERLGWTGDIAMFARTAAFNYDVSTFLRKWMFDLVDGQMVGGVEDGQFPMVAPRGAAVGGGPAWADAAIIVPWTLYEVYGDTRTLQDVYPALERWMGFLERQEQGRAPGAWAGFGDWVSLDAAPENPLGLDDRWGGTPLAFLRAVFTARATDLMARIATVLGRPDDARTWRDRFEHRRERFVAEFTIDGHLTTPTQTACVLALTFDLLPDPELRSRVAGDLARDVEQRGHLVTGFVGTPWLLHVLQDIGRIDLAYRVLMRQDLPGWLFPVVQGATTMWERWDAWTPDGGFHPSGMNSLNHYAYGAVGHWLHRTVGGLDVDPARPGTADLRIAPRPGGGITWARTSLHTVRGEARCDWTLDADGRLQVEVTVPANASAVVELPTTDAQDVTEDGQPIASLSAVSDLQVADGLVRLTIGAGTYRFGVARAAVV